MAPAYKLIYFNSQGVAETSRFLLKYGGIDFEDVRIEKSDWSQVKESYPFGQLPILEFNGKQLGQSIAIARYLGKEVKLAGNDNWEDLEIDAVVDTIRDLFNKLTMVHHQEDQAKKETLLVTATKETIPYYLSRLETVAKKNNGYLTLGRLTWADVYFATISPYFDYLTGNNSLASYPSLKALKYKVNSISAIKEWVQIRPNVDYLKCK